MIWGHKDFALKIQDSCFPLLPLQKNLNQHALHSLARCRARTKVTAATPPREACNRSSLLLIHSKLCAVFPCAAQPQSAKIVSCCNFEWHVLQTAHRTTPTDHIMAQGAGGEQKMSRPFGAGRVHLMRSMASVLVALRFHTEIVSS